MDLIPFNDFWLDCYSTMLYTILLSVSDVDKAYIYNNNYEYQLKKENMHTSNESFYSLQSFTQHTILAERLLRNEYEILFSDKKEPLNVIKNMLDDSKIVMLAIDLFYWIKENLHYQKNHIVHLSLLKSYDERGKQLKVFETGNLGYQEFIVPYERAIIAIDSAKSSSYIYNIDNELSELMYTKKDIVNNAKLIIKSIDIIRKNQELVWRLDAISENSMGFVSDIIKTHLFNMQNREKVNRHLFMIVLKDYNTDFFDYSIEFANLEQQFENLKNRLIKYEYQSGVKEGIKVIKEKVIDLLFRERDIWSRFLNMIK
ncbi:MAG: hypothetical protein GX972_02155 [Amphibacillus sp.]|nr:hypothetical protein [Amphibacillus sp.]